MSCLIWLLIPSERRLEKFYGQPMKKEEEEEGGGGGRRRSGRRR
jgi:hypothetical protein